MNEWVDGSSLCGEYDPSDPQNLRIDQDAYVHMGRVGTWCHQTVKWRSKSCEHLEMNQMKWNQGKCRFTASGRKWATLQHNREKKDKISVALLRASWTEGGSCPGWNFISVSTVSRTRNAVAPVYYSGRALPFYKRFGWMSKYGGKREGSQRFDHAAIRRTEQEPVTLDPWGSNQLWWRTGVEKELSSDIPRSVSRRRCWVFFLTAKGEGKVGHN